MPRWSRLTDAYGLQPTKLRLCVVRCHPLADRSACRCDPDDGPVEMLSAHGAVEGGVAEGEHPAVGGHLPVAAALGGGGDPHDGLVEGLSAHGAVEGGVTEGEEPAVGGHLPVAAAIGGGGDPDDGLVEVLPPIEP